MHLNTSFSVPNKEDSFCDIGWDYLCNETRERVKEEWETKFDELLVDWGLDKGTQEDMPLGLPQASLVSTHGQWTQRLEDESLRSLYWESVRWAWTTVWPCPSTESVSLSAGTSQAMPSTCWSTSGLPLEEGMTTHRLRNGNTQRPQPTTSPEHDQPPEAALSAGLGRAQEGQPILKEMLVSREP